MIASGGAARLPALDGVRGIAILLVLVFHGMQMSRPESLNRFDAAIDRITRGGWMGVDLFFVLSGFLITGILLDERGRPGALKSFMARRSLRVLPLYVSFLLILLLVVPFFSARDADEAILRGNQIWYWSFLLNFKIAADEVFALGFYGNGHLWSLMVEVQFYVVWGVALTIVPRRRTLHLILACIVVAPLLRLGLRLDAMPGLLPTAAGYVLLPTRMDSLAMGGLLAFAIRDRTMSNFLERCGFYLVVPGITALAILAYFQGELWLYDPWTQVLGYAAIAWLSFGILFLCLRYPDAAGRVDRLGLGALGRYSFGLYVIHLQLMRDLEPHWAMPDLLGSTVPSRLAFTAVTSSITLLIATVSWRFVERPFLDAKRRFWTSQPKVIGPSDAR